MNTSPFLGSSSRRAFLGQAAALAACVALPRYASAASAKAKPNSVFNGVRVGTISYSYRSMFSNAEQVLEALVTDGISEVELMGPAIQTYAGFNVTPSGGKGKKGGDAPPPVRYSDAQREAQLVKCRELRKLYNDAGVNIHIHKIAFGPSDEEVEFNFLVAKALGCMYEADSLVDAGNYVGFNFDVGHYVAGTKGKSPIPVLEKYHKRIVNLHMKDRTADGGNLPWGQGQTPLKEVLQLMRKEKWTFPANIELEYKIPEGSDAVKEVAKCVQYCREALA